MSELWIRGNIAIRPMEFGPVGTAAAVVEGHTHEFDHVTYVVRGSLLIESLNDDGSVRQSVTKRAADVYNSVLIKAGVKHRITALEDGSLGHCIYAHRNPQGDVVQEYDGWAPAYQ